MPREKNHAEDVGLIIVLGGHGYVGSAFQRCLSRNGLPFEVVSRRSIDYSDQDTLTRFLIEHRPMFLINTAGYTGRPNVDACELHKTECLAGNAVLPGVIRAACERALGACVIGMHLHGDEARWDWVFRDRFPQFLVPPEQL